MWFRKILKGFGLFSLTAFIVGLFCLMPFYGDILSWFWKILHRDGAPQWASALATFTAALVAILIALYGETWRNWLSRPDLHVSLLSGWGEARDDNLDNASFDWVPSHSGIQHVCALRIANFGKRTARNVILRLDALFKPPSSPMAQSHSDLIFSGSDFCWREQSTPAPINICKDELFILDVYKVHVQGDRVLILIQASCKEIIRVELN